METVNTYLKHQNMRTWLEHEAVQLGTDRDRERYASGHLAEAELRVLARRALFAPFVAATEVGDVRRWRPMLYSDVPHARPGCIGHVNFMKYPVDGPLGIFGGLLERANAHEWVRKTGDRLRAVLFQHVGTCEACKGTESVLSVHVSTLWAGRTLSLEYAI